MGNPHNYLSLPIITQKINPSFRRSVATVGISYGMVRDCRTTLFFAGDEVDNKEFREFNEFSELSA